MDITDTSPRGEGIACVKGLPIFIPNAKLGEHVTVKIKSVDSVSADAEKTA